MKKLAAVGISIIVILALVGAALWASIDYIMPKELDPAAVVPEGARFYMELDATHVNDADLAVADRYAAYVRTLIGGDYELPPMKELACRGAVIMYGSAKMQGMVPGLVIVFHSEKPDAGSPLEEKLLTLMNTAERNERELNGWKIIELKTKPRFGPNIYVGLARKDSLRIFATGKSLLEECITISESGTLDGSLAANKNFIEAFEGLPFAPIDHGFVGRLKSLVVKSPRASQRVYMDLKGICDDIHPMFSIVGGETYREIKENLLDHLKSAAGVAGPEQGGLRGISVLRLSSTPDWMKELETAQLEWPGRAPDNVAMSLSVATPSKLIEILAPLIRRAGAGRAKIGRVHGTFGTINAALSMYYADHAGKYPLAKTPTPISEIGIVPTYMAAAEKTPWNEPYLYVGDGTTYVLSVEHEGETMISYSSRTGRLENAPKAETFITSFAEEETRRLMTLAASVREVGISMLPNEKPGIDALMPTRRFNNAQKGLLALRFVDATAAASSETLLAELFGAGRESAPPIRVDGTWVYAGETKLMDALKPSGPSVPAVFHSYSVFDLTSIIPEEKRNGLPEAHRWSAISDGRAQGQTLIFESTTEPDPMPAILGVIASFIHADTWNLPHFGRHRARSPQRPSSGQDGATENGEGPTVGTAAPPLVGVGLDGKPISLEKFKGSVVVLDFWATWCGPCVREMPNMKEAFRRFESKGVKIIGISLDNDRAKLQEFITKEGIAWPQLFDGQAWRSPYATAYGVHSIPSIWIIGKDGRIAATHLRGEALLAKLEEMLK